MRTLDLLIVAAFLVWIVWEGVRRGRGVKDDKDYLLAGRKMRWWSMGLSVMATQASAITLISTTGQGFATGMKFLHFYLAVPFAMVVLCATVVPWFHRAGVYTAYQWLESRFDRTTRLLASVTFLFSRALAVGAVLYAPSIVLAIGVGVPQWASIAAMGFLCTLYTTVGGATAVITTDARQMLVMFAGIFACLAVAWWRLPAEVGVDGLFDLAGAAGKLDTFHLPSTAREALADPYNLLSALLGGFFLFLGYFGADQEQVQRYLAGSSVEQSRKSLLMSAFVKVPMQFVILLLGISIWCYFAWRPAPAFFREAELAEALERRDDAAADGLRQRFAALRDAHAQRVESRRERARELLAAERDGAADATLAARAAALRAEEAGLARLRSDGQQLVADAGLPQPKKADQDFAFTHFLVHEMPVGLAGLVLAAIFAAAMSSVVAPINSLATSSVVDVVALLRRAPMEPRQVVRATRFATAGWGLLGTCAAFFIGDRPIIETVNRIGSVVYGSLFGVFILGRLVPRARGRTGAVSLVSGLLAVLAVQHLVTNPGLQTTLLGIREPFKIEFMWFNLIGFAVVMAVGWVLSRFAAVAPPAPPAAPDPR